MPRPRATDRRLALCGVVAGMAMLAVTWTPFVSGLGEGASRFGSLWTSFGADALIVTSAAALVLMFAIFLRADWTIWLNRLIAASALAVLGLVAAHQLFDVVGLFANRLVYWAVYPPVAMIAAMQILAAYEKTASRDRSDAGDRASDHRDADSLPRAA
ncbi:MAG: hypothetical protein ACYTGG_09355 [Planctomycetota bacterium]|jgi:hypothetical protein